MLLQTQKYDATITYKPGPQMYLADTLSRAYIKNKRTKHEQFEHINATVFVPMTDEKKVQIRKSTESDEILQQLKAVILKGWPEERRDLPAVLTPYHSFRDELAIHDGFVYRGERLVIPKALRPAMKKEIHQSHIGTNGCLRRARESMFWPGMNAELKEYVAQCETCRQYESRNQKETLMSHRPTERPWEKVASDMFTLDGQDYLILVDYFSNFWEINRLPDTKASTVIRKVKSHFARHGIPDTLISDNGPQYTSQQFAEFAHQWGFDHYTSSPGHQQANGLAESAVKTAENLLRKAKADKNDPYLAILSHRNTPSESMETSPVQRLFGRRTKTTLPTTTELLKPKSLDPDRVKAKIDRRQKKQANYYNKKARDLQVLEEGDVVRMRPFTPHKKHWNKAVVNKRLDERSYEVETENGTYRRNRVDLKQTIEPSTAKEPQPQPLPQPLQREEPSGGSLDTTDTTATAPEPNLRPTRPRRERREPATAPEPNLRPTRPRRERKEPAYLKDYVK